MPSADEDIRWMRSALSLSNRGLGRVWPNPSVGCIIVRDGIVIGRGVTAAGGRPHAEAAALAQAGMAAKGATAYVTLEPCAFQGRDHSCSDKLIQAGITRVVAAVIDPNPNVNGQGIGKLRSAGILTECGLLKADALEINAGFFSRVERNRPMVTLKIAASLDGKIATAGGESRWITGSESRRFVHQLRSNHDAILIGSGTAIADDPMLDIRNIASNAHPVRVVFDTILKLSLTSNLVRTANQQPLLLVHGPKIGLAKAAELTRAGAQLIPAAVSVDGKIVLLDALAALAGHGLTRVLCEGGATLAASLIRSDFVDRLVIMNAGKLLGNDAINAMGNLGITELPQVPRFQLHQLRWLENDLCSEWWRRSPAPQTQS